MPKLSDTQMTARRQAILRAARRCFARRGFHATTIADLCAEAGISAGGLYTHFASKHAIVAAMGSDLTNPVEAPDLWAQLRHLQTEPGAQAARLDLQLWAAALSDPDLSEMVHGAMDALRQQLGDAGMPPARAQLIEALVLGLEVQRALGRSTQADLELELRHVVQGGSGG